MNDFTWVVVADEGRVRVFQAPGITLELQEIEDLVNTGAVSTQLSEKDAEKLSRDEQKEKVRKKFAKEISDYLEQARMQHKYSRLILVSEPKFLGALRHDLSEEIRSIIADQISEDLSTFSKEDIQLRLRRR